MTKKWIFEHMGVCVVEKDVFTGLKMGPKWGIWPLGHPAQRGSKRGYLAIYPQKPPKWVKKGVFWGHFGVKKGSKMGSFWDPLFEGGGPFPWGLLRGEAQRGSKKGSKKGSKRGHFGVILGVSQRGPFYCCSTRGMGLGGSKRGLGGSKRGHLGGSWLGFYP